MIVYDLPTRMLDGGDWHVGRRRVGRWPFVGRPHRHAGFHELMVCLAGSFANSVRGVSRQLRAGEVVFVGEDDEHQVHGRTFTSANIAFAVEYLDWAERTLDCRGHITALPERAQPAVLRLDAQQLHTVGERVAAINRTAQGGASPLLRLLLVELLHGLAEAREANAPEERPAWLREALRAFEALPPADWSRSLLRELCNRSDEHLCRSMRQHLGRSPTAYINDLRLERAASLLGEGEEDVTAIALAAGYESLNHFYVRFRRRYGCAPREFRRRQQEVY